MNKKKRRDKNTFLDKLPRFNKNILSLTNTIKLVRKLITEVILLILTTYSLYYTLTQNYTAFLEIINLIKKLY